MPRSTKLSTQPKPSHTKNKNQNLKNPYPYPVPPVEFPPENISTKLEGWNILEFLRIEALLRSAIVHTAFKQNLFWEELHLNFKVGPWKVLEGEHHCLIHDPHLRKNEGILDVSALHQSKGKGAVALDYNFLHYDHPRFLHLQIDLEVPIKALLSGLKKILSDKKNALAHDINKIPINHKTKEADFIVPGFPAPRFSLNRSPSYKPKVWIQYFRCYDLREATKLSYGQIGRKVYSDLSNQAYERTERAYKRVQQLIQAAETNQWPPDIS